MIENYLLIAKRSLLRRRLYSFINAFGLSTGIAFCVLIWLYIRDEQSFDQFHSKKDRIYRIDGNSYDTWKTDPNDHYSKMAWLQTGLGPALVDDTPEVEQFTRFNADASGVFRYGEKVFTEKVTYVDAGFFRMFSFKMLKGSAEKAFLNKNEVVLTPAIAAKYFGDEDPIGKIIEFDNEGKKLFTVTGIIEAPPENSSLVFSILLPQENRPYYQRNVDNWQNFGTPTFALLREGTDPNSFKANLDKLRDKHFGDKIEKWKKDSTVPIPDDVIMFEYIVTPLPEIHLATDISWHKVSDRKYSWILGGIAVLILTIACVNYILLALTTSASRRTEVGIRKTIGARQSQLVGQFTIESIALALISMLLGIGMVILLLPFFNQFTSKGIAIDWNNGPLFVSVSFAISMIVGVLAGGYPAFYLSRFRPALVLKGVQTRMRQGVTRVMVIGQFTLSAGLIICSIIMYQQMKFVTTKDLGYNKEQLIVIPTQTGWNPKADQTVAQFRAKALQDPDVIAVTGVTSAFNRGYSRYGYRIKGEQKIAYVFGVDTEYIPTLGLSLVQGRNFDTARPSDTLGVIVNEALVRDMKWEKPLEEHLNWREDSVGLGSPVIGVVKDYHFLSLQEAIEPMFLSMNKRDVGYLTDMIVKLKPGSLPDVLDRIKGMWIEIAADRPFEYTFVDDDVARQYESYERWTSITAASAGFAILISCLGLFGLAGINTVNRTKEIGIRKVMGAGSGHIMVIMSRPYIWMSLASFVLAIPASWYLMTRWLESFRFKIDMHWSLFAVSVVAGLVLALVTVSYHTWRAASVNPAETLKYE